MSISKKFRYSELHFKISPGNQVAFRHKFNLISTCSIHCVRMALGKRIEYVEYDLQVISVIVSLLIRNTE